MRTITLSICLFATLLCQTALADDREDFGNQMSYFYLTPSQESFDTFQEKADQFQNELESAGNGADILVAVMIAKISGAHNWPIRDSILGRKAQEILRGQSSLAIYVQDDSQVDPSKLDVWWASFFATGDENYLEKIFQYAGVELPKEDIGRMLIGGAATWSFKANCRQHKKVTEFARQKLNSLSTSKSQVKFLKECIEFAEMQETEPADLRDAPKPARP